ncbi:pyridoxal-phosphate-dependent aminotransferase family protein [Candidatus Xianfuyuplasma coldseepsis]|uniref:Alanine--glyoxylate aminotransferase family protein n=1 Tax=Candidatus Xianfuyuplasma coldseepsis TaxID=2782163 RepID=A0A7L7KNC1_9MOLU|nr:alanine--glyoxylate aminotransferase family protein [Xianfuyuplasma coldseepsis]QMS84200.1 alanine--glyoxylate aminotransferase family protein [Xianfuyuplasma coldseepsis]
MSIKLFIPGPTDVEPDVLQQLATTQIGHRSKTATELQKRISEKLQKLMYTDNTIILSTSSGSGIMEMAIRSCTQKRAAVFSVGAFGNRWFDMAKRNNIPADIFTPEPGKGVRPEMVEDVLKTGKYDVVTITHNETSSGIMNPVDTIGEVVKQYPDVLYLVDAVSSLGGAKIEVDKCGIDICLTSTQKCLGLPPGLSVASVSERAYNRAKDVPYRGYYLDLVNVVDRVKKNYQYPTTPVTPLMWALDYKLDKILEQEGLDHRFARHEKLANIVQKWALKHFDLYAEDGFRSHTVTTILNTKGYSVAELNQALMERGYMISNGYGSLKEKAFRIAHMADRQEDDLLDLLSIIEEIWNL